MKKILAFGHQKFTGKDTIIKFCIDILRPKLKGLRMVRRSFADKLYDICHIMYSWAGFRPRTYYMENPYAKNDVLLNGKTVRQMLIEIGTPVMRAYDDDVWINCALKSEDYDILFIGDLRFPNEFNKVRELGGTLIRVNRPNQPIPTDIADTALNDWSGKWDLTVTNDGTLNSLHAMANTIVEKYVL